MKTMPIDDAKTITEHAIAFERKLIAEWLKRALPEDDLNAIRTGDYKAHLSRGEKPAVEVALAETLKLQSHYAELLNMYDGGERIWFGSVDEIVGRLREIGTIGPDFSESSQNPPETS